MNFRPLRVLLLTTSYPLHPGSTSGVFIQRLVENLPKQVHITVLTPCGTSRKSPPTNIHCFRYAPRHQQRLAHLPGGIPVALKQSMLMRILLPLFLISMLLSCFRQARNVDIIHANWSINGALAGLVGRFLKIPVITTLRGEDITKAGKSIFSRFLLTACLHSNDHIVTVSEAIRKKLTQSYTQHENKITFIPNGVASEFLTSAPKNSTHQSNSPFKLITVGSLIPRKSIATLITALHQLQKTNGNYILKIIGDGAEKQKLKKLVKKNGMEDIVEFTGTLAPTKIAQQLISADAFILCSHSEGRPNVILESLAIGTPVIATNIDGVKELIEDGTTGLLFKPGKAQQLADKIMQLATDEGLRITLAHKGRQYIDEHKLYWKETGNRYTKLYYTTIENRVSGCAD